MSKDPYRLRSIMLLTAALICVGFAIIGTIQHQQELQDADTATRDAVQREVSGLIHHITDYFSQIRSQSIALGEDILTQLPLPLTDLPPEVLRDLDANSASMVSGNIEVFVVSTNVATRQFSSSNRPFPRSFLFQVSLGEAVGPTAEPLDSGYRLILAEPLSQASWMVLVRVDPEILLRQLGTLLAANGYLRLDQAGGSADPVRLLEIGSGDSEHRVVRNPGVLNWMLTFDPSPILLSTSARSQLPWLALAQGFSLVALLFLAGAAYCWTRREKPIVVDATDDLEERKPYNPIATQTFLADVSAGSRHVKDASDAVDDFISLKPQELPEKIFRAYDIRGKAETQITPRFARQLGRSFAEILSQRDGAHAYVCRDGRLSSPDLATALIRGLTESGCAVTDLGVGPTPLLSRAIQKDSGSTGIMITASHNGADYNGFKITVEGRPYFGARLTELRNHMSVGSFTPGEGRKRTQDFSREYLQAILADIPSMTGMRVVVDGGNGAAGPLCEQVFNALECTTEAIFCDIDGNFPNHGPDPSKEANVHSLREAVLDNRAHLGIALDGDGDRLVAVDDLGRVLSPDQLYLLFARHVLLARPGATLVFDVKASRRVPEYIARWGGRPVRERSGRTFVQMRVLQETAVFGGEYSSHYFFGDRWNAIDDGIYAACRLAHILRVHNCPLSQILEDIPLPPSTPEITLAAGDQKKWQLLKTFIDGCQFPGADLVRIDGLRVEYPRSWGLVRSSNTGPHLTLRFEGETEQDLEEIKSRFRDEFTRLIPQLEINF